MHHVMRRLFAALGLITCLAIVGALALESTSPLLHGLGLLTFSLSAVALLIFGCLTVTLRRSLPRVNGTVKVSGLHAPIEIIRDSDAVPHIYAASKRDASFGLGYVHAQDRLWQMDFQRRIGQGRLSEILGDRALPMDRFLRTLGVHRAARSAWDLLPPESQETISDYVAGVNAFLSSHRGSKLPPEFLILRCKPEPWTGSDVLVWNKMMAWNLSSNMGTELLRGDILEAAGPARIDELFPGDPTDGPTILPAQAQAADHEDLVEIEANIRTLMGAGGSPGAGLGSNNWVVDSTKSDSGKPVLANDPHLGTGIPSIWYLAHLSGGDLDVIGATIPGLPSVVIGRNRSIAWGVTNLNPDSQDLYRERIDLTGCLAEFEGAMEQLEFLTEIIKVKGKPDINHTVRVTRHGPLISDAINANNALKPEPARGVTREPLALRWTALDPGDTTVAAFQKINEAANWDEFRSALTLYMTPAQNFVYADIEGNIGAYSPGRIPIRASGDGAFPAEGWSGSREWTGWVPFNELPHSYNPPEHFAANANNKPVSADYPYFLGREWQPRYRVERITELLREKHKLTVADHIAIQADVVSMQARQILPTLLSLVKPSDENERLAAALLKEWDYHMRCECAEPVIFAAWARLLPRAFLSDMLGPELMGVYEERYNFTSRFVAATLADSAQRERCEAVAVQTFREALAFLTTNLGPNIEIWRWDKLHSIVFPHQPFDQAGPLKHLFSRTTRGGGDCSSVNPGFYPASGPFEQRLAALYRHVIDLSSLDGGLYIYAGGQSGHFLSRHYADYLSDWHAVRYRPMRFDRATVERDRTATLWLQPS